MSLQVGDLAPDFSMTTDDGQTISLRDLRGRKVVLYFYPKDDTPGCTREACSFRDNLPIFANVNAEIVGVSRDDTDSHRSFRDKYGLNFMLASDADGTVVNDYGVWKEKSLYGRTFMGIERSTFLIDENGKIEAMWPRVQVDGHTEQVLAAIRGEPVPSVPAEEPASSAAAEPAAKPAVKAKARPSAKKAAARKKAAPKKKARKVPAKRAAKGAKRAAKKSAAAKRPARKTAKKTAKKTGKKSVKKTKRKAAKKKR